MLLTAVLSSAAIAQTSASPPATKPAPATSATDSSKTSIPTQVEKWTKDQWEAAKKEWAKDTAKGAVAELVGIEVGVVSGVMNLESSGVEASDWRLRHDQGYHEA
jgi:hypothetical protein